MPKSRPSPTVAEQPSLVSVEEIHPSLRASFVPLPSDPNVPLTPEQLKAIFPNPHAWRDVIALVMAQTGVEVTIIQESA